MTLEQNITNDEQSRRKSRIVLPGTSEYEAGMRRLREANKNQEKTNKGKKGRKSSEGDSPRTMPTGSFNVDSLINIDPEKDIFYSEDQDSDGNYIGLPIALKQALNHAGTNGYVATMPELIAAKLKAGKNHNFWKNWFTTHTEENIGIDKKGRFYSANEPVLVIVNGGGILTPERIKQAYAEDLIDNSARYTEEEFDNLLDGNLLDGSSIKLHSLEDIRQRVLDLPHRFGVVMPYSVAQGTKSGYHKKKDFITNPLAIARNAGSENLEEYHELAKHSDGDLGCYHPFNGRDASVPQGRVLFLGSSYLGLSGYGYLDYNGRFVGVRAPEAQK